MVGHVGELVQLPLGTGLGTDHTEPFVRVQPGRRFRLGDHVYDIDPRGVLVQGTQCGTQQFFSPSARVLPQEHRVHGEGDLLQPHDVEVLERDRRFQVAVDVAVAGQPVQADLDARRFGRHGALDPVRTWADQPFVGQVGVGGPELDLDALVLADPQVFRGVGAQPGQADHLGLAVVLPCLDVAARCLAGVTRGRGDRDDVAGVFLQQRPQYPADGALVSLLHGEAEPTVIQRGHREPGTSAASSALGDQVVVEPAREVDGEAGVHVADPAVGRLGATFECPSPARRTRRRALRCRRASRRFRVRARPPPTLRRTPAGRVLRGGRAHRLGNEPLVDVNRGVHRRRTGHVTNSVSSLEGAGGGK